jgi:3-deoxy-D-manno-octulosonic-acid transferase
VTAKRFLVIRLSSIGDVLHCTPVVRELKQAFPTAHITWVVGRGAADLLKANPYIDEVYVWPREKWEDHMRHGRFAEAWKLWQQLRLDLRARNFDIVLDVHGLFLSGMVALASGAKRRIGLSNTRELNSLFMTEIAPAAEHEQHIIQRYLSILQPFGIKPGSYNMTLELTKPDLDFADQFLDSAGIKPQQQLVALIPATTWAAKNWPPEYFAELADALAQHVRVMLCGGPADRYLAQQVLQKTSAPVIDAVGQTNLPQLAALLKKATVVVTGDTGPLHMAIAMGVPTVSIFGPTNPKRFGPLVQGHSVLEAELGCRTCHKMRCRFSHQQCMKDVLPQQVIQAIRPYLH